MWMLLPMNSPIAGAVTLSRMLHGSTFGSMKAGLLTLREGYVYYAIYPFCIFVPFALFFSADC